jgi:flagellar hook-associated protein 2
VYGAGGINMGTIGTGIGLISGLNIAQLVDRLIALEARPAGLLQRQIDRNTAVQSAFQAVSLSFASARLAVSRLGSGQAFAGRTATSSSSSVSVSAAAGAATGSFSVVPRQLASTQQVISGGFSSAAATVGSGIFTISNGGFVDSDNRLSTLNGGEGVRAGSIRITNRAGISAEIDLTAAVTITDVVAAINQSSALAVTASADGRRLRLVDASGGTGTLSIQNVGSGSTATDLGLTTLTQSGNTFTGQDIVRLGTGLDLRAVNDGNGVRSAGGADDFEIQLSGGSTTFQVRVDQARTVGDVASTIETATGGRVDVSISGGSLVLTDTLGGGSVSVVALNNSLAAFDLGILGSSSTDVLTGRDILGELTTVLLNSLNGGFRGGTDTQVQPGVIQIDSTSIDLTGAVTLDDVVAGINAQSGTTNVTAAVNRARNGITLTNTSGADFTVADASGNLAAFLNIAGASVSGVFASGDLGRQFISEVTELASLNGGAGISAGRFRIIDGFGAQAVIDLTQEADRTIGDVLTQINAVGLAVTARINDTGDGIVVEHLGGGGVLQILEESAGSTATDLRIVGTAVGGVINGRFRTEISITNTDSLDDIVELINESGAPVTATLINDGTGLNPIRINVASRQSGLAGELLIDTGATALSFTEIARPRDAVLLLGDLSSGAQVLQLQNGSNTFANAVSGVTVTVLGTSDSTANITVAQDTNGIVNAVADFVDSVNALRGVINEFSTFNAETGERGALFADATMQLAERALAGLLAGTIENTGSTIAALGLLGISLNPDGTLDFDEAVLRQALADDPANVERFFTTSETGFVAQFQGLVDGLTDDGGLLTGRIQTLGDTIARQNDALDDLGDRLEVRRQQLLQQFFRLEVALSRLQSQQFALSQLAVLTFPAQGVQGVVGF